MPFFFADILARIQPWFLNHGPRLVIILLLTLLANRFAGILIEKLIRRLVASRPFESPEAEKKREDTLVHICLTTLRLVVWIVAILLLLQEMGFAIGPLMAAAGVAGVALGFGGQYLIRDLFTGLFLIMENQYRIGDVVCFDQTCGMVENITLRMTTLRDLDGVVHHVPHGEVKRVSNLSKNFARVNVNVPVPYKVDLEKVITIINRVGNELFNDETWKKHLITPPQFLRVEDFTESLLTLKVLGDTQPLKQWDVAGELRRRLKLAFEREGISMG